MADLSKLREALSKLDLATDKIKAGERSMGDWGAALDSQLAVIAAARDAAAQADAQPAVAAVPDRSAMLAAVSAMEREWDEWATENQGTRECFEAAFRAGYAAMLSAAPAAPASEGVDEDAVTRLAFYLAEKDGHDDPHALIWEGSPPEPWGEVWNRYEPEARELLAAAAAKPGEVGR
jgi:hypothetical protein